MIGEKRGWLDKLDWRPPTAAERNRAAEAMRAHVQDQADVMGKPGSGRVWFLGQTPPPVEATQDELDAEGMAKLAGWVREAIVAKGMGIDLDELDVWVHDLKDTAPAPRGAVYRTTEGAAMSVDYETPGD